MIFLYFPCYDIIGLPSPLVFYAVVEIAMRFFGIYLSLLRYWCVIEVKTEVVASTSVLYSCKTLTTFKMSDIIILVKRDKLPPHGSQRLQRINAVEKIITYRRGPLTFGKWTRKAIFRSGLAV